MGLLDDAIREHLELKRRRGADLDEIARQEDEALGDPRSGEFARPDAEAPEEEPPAEENELPAEEDEFPAEEELPPEPPAPAAYQAEPEPPGHEEQPWLDDDRIDPVGVQPTAEFTQSEAESEAEPASPDAEEDVLEETPDFLQETPEHDRLWFEQKPPRDFDFDN
jgi:hypothetical protein